MDAGSSSSFQLPRQFRQFTISEIQSATVNFDESLVIGHGGFGKVYKGTISDGASDLVVAIKRLDSSSNQGAAEFFAEVQMLSKLRHCHLVSLIGYCNDGEEMVLVYEYMPRGTLEDHLHKFLSPLPWVRRLKICIGAARGLDYLHTGTGTKDGVIHRDVKSSNILLDDSWDAKISDFGLSKIGPINQPSTYVKTMVKGTFGYLDPYYFATGRLTRKSDVYAFGVVLLEVLTGKQALDTSLDEDWGLVNWAQEYIKEGRLKEMVDYSTRERILPKCLKEFARLADRCVHNNPKQRPTMAEVVGCLESVLTLQEKANNALHPAGMTVFGNKMPMFLSSFSGDKSVGIRRYWELYFDTIGGENRILHKFEYRTINIATDNFSRNNRISEGKRLGSMYKGRLQNGQGVSIARHHYVYNSRYYKNEVALLVKLEHENLLKLVGYSIEGTEVFLVYEFALYARLDRVIDDHGCTLLDWNKRKKIILGVARALLYLHQHAPFRIIHRHVTRENILLDESLDPKLSSFGIARCLETNEADCIKEERVYGTFGYIAPEYAAKSHLSTKADVYSFGLLMLETIGGCTMRNCMYNSTATGMAFDFPAWTKWVEGTSLKIIDPRIHAHSSSIRRVIHIGLLCVQRDPADRPTMEEVVGMLTNRLPVPKKHFSPLIKETEILLSDDYDSGAVEDFISELHPR